MWRAVYWAEGAKGLTIHSRLDHLANYATSYVPYYRRFRKTIAGDICYLSLPIIDKEVYRNHSSSFISTDPALRPQVYEDTTGSTGIPIRVVRTSAEQRSVVAALWRERKRWGIDPSVNIAQFVSSYGSASVVAKSTNTSGTRTYRLSTLHLGDSYCYEFWNHLRDGERKMMVAPPSVATHFAEYIRRSGRSTSRLGIEFVEVAGEVLYESQRDTIQDVLQCRVVNHYGAREFWAIAYECQMRKLHVLSDQVFVENLDANMAVPELVCTALRKRLQPFIRYRVGDYAEVKGGRCQCGRDGPFLSNVIGRANDLIETVRGEKIHPVLIKYVLSDVVGDSDDCVMQVYCEQARKDRIILYVRVGARFRPEYAGEIRRRLQHYLGSEMRVMFEFVDEIDFFFKGNKLQTFSRIGASSGENSG